MNGDRPSPRPADPAQPPDPAVRAACPRAARPRLSGSHREV